MGNDSTKVKPREEMIIQGLLRTNRLENQNYDIENLVFANCGSAGASYVGAVSVLEKLEILQNIKRFSGVANGAIFATLLAIGLQPNELQSAFNEYLVRVQRDDQIGFEKYSEKLTVGYGWNTGSNFFAWFGEHLRSKSFLPFLTFEQLYKKTGKELCLVVTNVNTLLIEYFHPKTTPDLSIMKALFMAISIPGIFVPAKYRPVDDESLYANGNLLCKYPIHCFDGWLLSMEENDSFLNKLESPADIYQPQVFDPKNVKTIGFLPFDKRRESHCKGFAERVPSSKVKTIIPSTTVAFDFIAARQGRNTLEHKFGLLTKACFNLLVMAGELADPEDNIPVDIFTHKVLTGNSLTRTDRLLFPEIGKTEQELNDFLVTLSVTEGKFSLLSLRLYIQKKLLRLLDEYSAYQWTGVNSLRSYFVNLFDTGFSSNTILSESDYDRTVGILYGYIESYHVDFEEADQTFLYRQGWNDTVRYLQNYCLQID